MRGVLMVGRFGSVGVLEEEELFDGFVEKAGHLEGQDGGGDIFAQFNGVYSLASNADTLGQFALGKIHFGAGYFQFIFHSTVSFEIGFGRE